MPVKNQDTADNGNVHVHVHVRSESGQQVGSTHYNTNSLFHKTQKWNDSIHVLYVRTLGNNSHQTREKLSYENTQYPKQADKECKGRFVGSKESSCDRGWAGMAILARRGEELDDQGTYSLS